MSEEEKKRRKAISNKRYVQSVTGKAAKKLANDRYYENNKEDLIEKQRTRDRTEASKKYYEGRKSKDPGFMSRNRTARKKKVIQATFVGADPEFYEFFMEEIYSLSRYRTEKTGIQHNVDHIVPLVSDKVCGLHTPCNLRIITETENKRKSNTWVS